MDRKRIEAFASIPKKANRILFFFLIGLLIIILRIWHLTVVQQTTIEQSASRLRRKMTITPAYRGTIRDRFHVPLAVNAIDYRVGIQWMPIKEIPKKISIDGTTRYLRNEYILAFCHKIGQELGEDPTAIEDALYSYAALSPNTPVILKTNLHENDYYRFNILAKDWPGLVVERSFRRIYPRGRTAAHVIGYTSSLSRREYDYNLFELSVLKSYVDAIERGEDRDLPSGCASFFEAKKRLLLLERMSYGFNDEIGKMGVEASFERSLRGFYGKKHFYTNAHGDIVRIAPGSSEPIPGKRIILTISTLLQEECEKLLATSEQERSSRLLDDPVRLQKGAKDPFVRGGAIVAMDPKTGEILALASYPRFNPNDFVRPPPCNLKKRPSGILDRWLESESYLQRVFDCEIPFTQETVHQKQFLDTEQPLSWDLFLHKILPPAAKELSLLHSKMKAISLIALQEQPSIAADIARLLIRREELTPTLINSLKTLSIGDLRNLICAKTNFCMAVKRELRTSFAQNAFKAWRKDHGTAFLAEKRKQEASTHLVPKPYVKYLEAEQDRQFTLFWQSHEQEILLSAFGLTQNSPQDWTHTALRKALAQCKHLKKPLLQLKELLKTLSIEDARELLASLKGYSSLTHPLVGTYTATSHAKRPKTGQDLIKTILSLRVPPMASLCYMNPSAPGSIFKLVVAYCALRQQVESFKKDLPELSPNILHITDHTFIQNGKTYVGTDATGKPIPQLYKGGRIPRSVHNNNGPVNLVSAIAKSSNPYFALLAAEVIDSPQRLLKTAKDLGFGKKTGIAIPSEASGRLPSDLETNKTGLYTTAIGQHTLLTTPLQMAVALSALSNGGKVVLPRLIKVTIGPQISSENDLAAKHSLGSRSLQPLGISVPLWLSESSHFLKSHIEIPSTKTRRTIPITPQERKLLFQGMQGALLHALEDDSLKKLHLDIISTVQHIKQKMIGKSSTAESLERLGLGIGQPPYMYNHTWFAGLYFDHNIKDPSFFLHNDPSLVVVVFLRYGTYGKDAAHIAARVCHAWEQIKSTQQASLD